MENNLGKIYEIRINYGVIESVSVYIDNEANYKALKGYRSPRTAYMIAEFNGGEAINVIMKDIGVGEIELDVNCTTYGVHSRLRHYLASGVRVIIDGVTFMAPAKSLDSVKKVTLLQDESIGEVKIDALYSGGITNLTYGEYSFIQSIWGCHSTEEAMVDATKKTFVVETFDGLAFNYYKSHESGCVKVVRNVSTLNGLTCRGVFTVNTGDILLEFKAIEESYCISRDEIMPIGSIFYASRDTITMMK